MASREAGNYRKENDSAANSLSEPLINAPRTRFSHGYTPNGIDGARGGYDEK